MLSEDYFNFDKIFSYTHLYKSYLFCRKGVRWKEMVQRYSSQANYNTYKLWKELREGKWRHKAYYQFTKYEYGKKRLIQAEYFADRIVQRCFCEYSLIPILTSKMIYDNSASQKGKGIDFAIKRCKKHLRDHINKYGNNGYILQFDFRHYFASIPKENVHKILEKFYNDKRILSVSFSMIEAFEEGLGLGSQLSQTFALYYPNQLDHKIKEFYRIKAYGRYMDDGYIISNDKEKLLKILDFLRSWCNENGLQLNEKKTTINKLSKGFTFLKKRFIITKSNKIICTINKKNVHNMKHKLRILWYKFKLPKDYIENMLKSWVNTNKKYNCYRQLCNIKNYVRLIYDTN